MKTVRDRMSIFWSSSLLVVAICSLMWLTCADEFQYRGSVIGSDNSSAEYCETDTFHPRCPEGYVIMMLKALYGRMRIGRCVQADLGYLRCHTDVLRLTDARCSGLQECEIRIPDSEFDATKPCFKELKIYMEAAYTCVPVSKPPQGVCGDSVDLYTDISKPGYLMPGSLDDQEWCQGAAVEWHITAQPGQRINLTLLDLSMTDDTPSHDIPSTPLCTWRYGEVSEPSMFRPVSICRHGGTEESSRAQHVYLSGTSTVHVTLTIGSSGQEDKRFMIMYQAVGCPEMDITPGTWFRRVSDNEGEYGCLHDDTVQRVYCKNNEWQGVVKECEPSVPANKTDVKLAKHGQSKPGATALLAAGIACGLTVVVFIVGIIVTRCWARTRDPPRPTHHAKHSSTLVSKTTGFPPDLYSRAPASQQCGLCTEVAPFLTTSVDGKSTTLRYQCVHHGGPLSPPADWIYQCSPQNPAVTVAGAPATSTGTPATITHESPLTQDNQSAGGDYMLYMCPGHEVMDQMSRNAEEIYQPGRRQLDPADQGQNASGICGEVQTGACTCDPQSGSCEQYGSGMCTTCDCMNGSDLVNCTQQRGQQHADSIPEQLADITTLDKTQRDYNIEVQGREDMRFMNIHAPPIK